ncbi:Phage Tail Protein X [Brevundimonas diminuta]|jgi:phage tail protein X|uniref:tail protein X n=1 Tax=Brevundimonas TaxID=41275 RepID=UPI000207F768|nr:MULTISPECIES: tail protein X [Brevundimonas]EGF94637.1 phage Tail Protein X family protein [Brevundimonas diminuta ATCC 11568]OWR21734.1 phage tail protein [Brevundimonas diminuta]WQE46588.1 tail protein X [Brevundimonas diminuta]SPU47954.1 Phage Tail Protein X [Brevundimonas diminuta]SUW15842.1 Phage Tail Protein X [Brevundimonas diminuta]
MAAYQAISEPGDTVDRLVWREIRQGPAAVERVLEANPGLADLGTILPVGTAVIIPVGARAASAKPQVQLWD